MAALCYFAVQLFWWRGGSLQSVCMVGGCCWTLWLVPFSVFGHLMDPHQRISVHQFLSATVIPLCDSSGKRKKKKTTTKKESLKLETQRIMIHSHTCRSRRMCVIAFACNCRATHKCKQQLRLKKIWVCLNYALAARGRFSRTRNLTTGSVTHMQIFPSAVGYVKSRSQGLCHSNFTALVFRPARVSL